jgi:transposase
VLVEAALKFDPFSRNIYGFVNERRNQIKVLYWQRSGFCLWHKRLEEERFQWPSRLEGPVITLTEEQFAWLLRGARPETFAAAPYARVSNGFSRMRTTLLGQVKHPCHIVGIGNDSWHQAPQLSAVFPPPRHPELC